CRSFSAVFEKDNPTRVRLFEIYENADAFKAHLETPHFKKYAETTKDMVKSRKRIDSVPITLQREGEVSSKVRRRSASVDCRLAARRLVPAAPLGRRTGRPGAAPS